MNEIMVSIFAHIWMKQDTRPAINLQHRKRICTCRSAVNLPCPHCSLDAIVNELRGHADMA